MMNCGQCEPSCNDGSRRGRQPDRRSGQRSRVPERNRTGHGAGRAQRHAIAPAQTRLKISVPFVPPNPNELERAARIGICLAASGT